MTAIVRHEDTPIPISVYRQEPRVDSRVLARGLGIQPGNLLELIYKYQEQVERFGILPFKTEKSGKRGQPERYALLNEDQAHFVLALSRNTPRVVELKARLVLALRNYREGLAVQADYLPFHHALHDEVKALAELAHSAGSKTPEAVFHLNVEKMINRAFGIDAGDRQHLAPALKLRLASANLVAREALAAAIAAGADYHQAYSRAKAAVTAYAAGGPVLIAGGSR